METTEFRIRPYSKKELAALYFPSTKNSSTAVANLRNLLMRNPSLMRELREAGYRPTQRYLTAKWVRIIVRYLGEP